ncbi:hypothetical protein [Burkholderia vietnamiensis]|uniref:hypothetical protein n=1 Tax=Burkholderia vietnamiensis TaxID=60552 RepID=UPI0010417BC3|nr:hypothetical protein [Burkholderia vietnamiensis]
MIFKLLAVVIAFSGRFAHAQELYHAAAPDAVYCKSVKEALQQAGPTCRPLNPDLIFGIAEGLPDVPGLKRIGGVSDDPTNWGYIPRDLPLTKAGPRASDFCSSHDVPPSGEFDRWVLMKDGTPKLKRFMVTSKCVDGHLKSTVKRLN